MDSEQAALGGVLDTDQHDPAIQAASALTSVPQASSPSAEPPWPRDLAETIASFLCPVDALALDASGTATRCVVVERNRHFATNQVFTVSEHRAHRLLTVPLGGARTRVHTVGITAKYTHPQIMQARKGIVEALSLRGISSGVTIKAYAEVPVKVKNSKMAFVDASSA